MVAFHSQLLCNPSTVYAKRCPANVTLERQQFTPIDRHVGTNRCVLPWAFLYSKTLQPDALKAALAQALDQFPSLASRCAGFPRNLPKPKQVLQYYSGTTSAQTFVIRVQPIKAPEGSGFCCLGTRTDVANASQTGPASMHKPDWQLLLCNAGVPFSVYSSSCSFQDVVESRCMNSRRGFKFPDTSNKAPLPPYMEPLDPLQVLASNAPVMAVRLTQLAGGGSILAITASHVVLDGRSYVTFLKHWADLYNKLNVPPITNKDPAAAAAATATPSSSSSSSILSNKKVLSDIATGAYVPTKQQDPQLPNGASSSPLHDNNIQHSTLSDISTSKVTVISRTASHQPSSTTAEAPDDASLQLSNSINSTASTVVSTWSGVGGSCAAAAAVHRKHSGEDAHTTAVDTEAAAANTAPAPAGAAAAPATAEAAMAVADFAAMQQAATTDGKSPDADIISLLATAATAPSAQQRRTGASQCSPNDEAAAEPPVSPAVTAVKPFVYTPDPLYATQVPQPGWLSAFKAVKAAHKQIKAEESHVQRAINEGLIPVAASSSSSSSSAGGKGGEKLDMSVLSTELLHIPAKAVERLKAAASSYCCDGQFISSNDALSSLVWLLMGSLRKRPLPGQARTADMQDTYLGVALDLRTTAAAAAAYTDSRSKQQQQQHSSNLPYNYFGSAAWSISVRSCNKDGNPCEDKTLGLPIGWHKWLNPREWRLICSDKTLVTQSLAAGAARIRGALQAMREDENFTMKLLQQIDEGIAAPLSSQLSYGAGFIRKIDGFVTSWQFGVWDVGFGGRGPDSFQGLVHPVPPYHAVIMPGPPAGIADDQAVRSVPSRCAAGGSSSSGDKSSSSSRDGVWMWLTVPLCLVPAMKELTVMQLLVPDAHWIPA